jgi:hypothetical protein
MTGKQAKARLDLVTRHLSLVTAFLTNWISPLRESVPATPARESKYGTSETCADSRAAGRTSGSGCILGKKTSACDSISLLMISLPLFPKS